MWNEFSVANRNFQGRLGISIGGNEFSMEAHIYYNIKQEYTVDEQEFIMENRHFQ